MSEIAVEISKLSMGLAAMIMAIIALKIALKLRRGTTKAEQVNKPKCRPLFPHTESILLQDENAQKAGLQMLLASTGVERDILKARMNRIALLIDRHHNQKEEKRPATEHQDSAEHLIGVIWLIATSGEKTNAKT